MEKIYRAVKYIRTSCPDEESQSRDSVVNQRRHIDSFLTAHPEITVAVERIDDGYSGLFCGRPAFNEMVADIQAGRVNCVIVKDLSRLWRNYIETGKCFRDLFQPNGVRFISIDDAIDSVQMDGTEKMFLLIRSIFNEQYSYDISVKTRSSLAAKRRQGQYVGAVPIYGYRRAVDNKHGLAVDKNTCGTVQSIFRMKLRGLSAAGIASELNSAGILSPIAYKRNQEIPHATGGFADKRDAHWSATTILRILKDETYTGTLVQGRRRNVSYKTKVLLDVDKINWNRAENVHPPIVSKADFEAVQRILASDTRISPKHGELYVFSGLLICGCCGGNMTRKTNTNNIKQYVYYYCPTGKRGGCVSSNMISEDNLFHMVTRKTNDRIARIESRMRNLQDADLPALLERDCIQQISIRENGIQTLREFKRHLLRSLNCGLIESSEFQTFQKHYDREITRQEEEIVALKRKGFSIEASYADELKWTSVFLRFAGLNKIDRLTAVKMIRSVRISGKREIAVEFVFQREYEQLVRLSRLGGVGDG
jgi:DNA invertase Pin-like site-specific DNA recombinase